MKKIVAAWEIKIFKEISYVSRDQCTWHLDSCDEISHKHLWDVGFWPT